MRVKTARLRLMRVFLEDRDHWWFGTDLSRAAKVGPGSLYVALAILESSDIIESSWSDGPERRRQYRADRCLS